MFVKFLNLPVHMNENKKNLTLRKALKTPNFKGRNETKTEKDHIRRKINSKKKFFVKSYYYFDLMKPRAGWARTAKN